MCVLGMVRSSRRLTACDVGTTVDTWSASVLELMPYFCSFYAKDNSDPEVVGLLFGVSANHAEWRSVHSLSSASSLFSHLEFGQYVMSPLYLAVLVRCLVYLSGAMLCPTMDTCYASDSMVQFLVLSSTCPLVCNNRALVRQWRKLWVPQLLLLFVVAVSGLQVVQILWCKCGRDSRIPQLQLVVRVPGQGR